MSCSGTMIIVDGFDYIRKRRRYKSKNHRREIFDRWIKFYKVALGEHFIHFIPDEPVWSEPAPDKKIKSEDMPKTIITEEQLSFIKEKADSLTPKIISRLSGVPLNMVYYYLTQFRLIKSEPEPEPVKVIEKRPEARYSNRNDRLDKYFTP